MTVGAFAAWAADTFPTASPRSIGELVTYFNERDSRAIAPPAYFGGPPKTTHVIHVTARSVATPHIPVMMGVTTICS